MSHLCNWKMRQSNNSQVQMKRVHLKIRHWSLKTKSLYLNASTKQSSTRQTHVRCKCCFLRNWVRSFFSTTVPAILAKEDRTTPALGQRHLSISILLQRLITLLCTSHTRQCAPSLKWYKIHMVQPVPPVMLGCWGTLVGGERESGGQRGPAVGRSWQARSRGKTLGC